MSQASNPLSECTNQPASWLVFFLLGALVVFAPLLRGGNRQVALMVLLAIGLLLLATLFSSATFAKLQAPQSSPPAPRQYQEPVWWYLLIGLLGTSPLWLGLLQLTALPASLWSSLAGRDVYFPVLQSAGLSPPKALPLSLQPSATWTSLLAGIPVAAAFFAALAIEHKHTEKIFGLLLGGGICQILLALLQTFQGPQSFFYFNIAGAGFVGSFANRNHLADFLAMLIPVWFYTLSQTQKKSHSKANSPRLQALAAIKLPLLLLLGFSMLIVILSTLSRGGILSATLVLLASTLLFLPTLRKKISTQQRTGLGASLALFCLMAIAAVGMEGIGKRIDKEHIFLDSEVRGTFARSTLDAARQFWPWGSGAGTFESVFPRFQAQNSLGYVNQAHNDYAQLMMELGAPGLALSLALLALVLYQSRRLMAAYRHDGRISRTTALCGFSGLGALALLAHSLVDYNMHIPALAITAAFLMGTFLRPHSG